MQLPKISIVLVTYLESSKPYLDACVKSIEGLNYPKENLDLVLVSSGEYRPPSPFKKHVHSSARMHFPEAVNLGVEHTDISTEHILILNDDTILTPDSLIGLVDVAQNKNCIVGPISPCDNYMAYQLQFYYWENETTPRPIFNRFHRWDDFKDKTEMLNRAKSIYPAGAIARPFICFYAVLIPRAVWFKVGQLDPNFKTGQDDIDYSYRVKQNGFGVYIALHSLIWHFGGVTADQTLTTEIRKGNIEYFRQKWGALPP